MSRLKFHEAEARERTVADVCLLALANRPLDRVLVIDDLDGHVQAGLQRRGVQVDAWTRWKVGDRPASTWPAPPEFPYRVVLMRLPRIKDAFEMALHAAASVLAEDGELIVYGGNDEGIKSSATLMGTVFSSTTTLDTRKHCRVMGGRGVKRDEVRAGLKRWRKDNDERVYYPGVFARGELDPATKMLVDALPPLSGEVLDFACGAGVIAAEILDKNPGVRVTMSDADAIALAAAVENVSAGIAVLSDGFLQVEGSFDAIVSNPPIHRGTVEDFTVFRDLVETSVDRLKPAGKLIFVVQRQVSLKTWPAEYSNVEEIAGDGRFKVIQCTRK